MAVVRQVVFRIRPTDTATVRELLNGIRIPVVLG